jgi:MFS family permease
MPPARMQPHVRIVNELTATDPEAESHLREARHWRVLEASSKISEEKAFALHRSARRRYEDSRNIVDPERRRRVHFLVGLAVLALAAVALASLTHMELGGVQAGRPASPLVIGATAVWLGWAWRAAIARRDHERGQTVALTVTSGVLAATLAFLYEDAPSEWMKGWRGDLPGVLLALLIIGIVAATSAIIERTEPAQLLVARWQWRRAQRAHERAVKDARAAALSAAAALTAWLTLVRARIWEAISCERLARECVAYAAKMVATGAELPERSERSRS